MNKFLPLILLMNVLWANVDPFILSNTQNINRPQTLIPLPKEQQIDMKYMKDNKVQLSKTTALSFLIKPHETVYIDPEAEISTKIIVQTSLDGRLFEDETLVKNKKYYTFYNQHNNVLAVKLLSMADMNVSLYTTNNVSPLHVIKAVEVKLPGERMDIVTPLGTSKKQYYHLKKKKKFSFKIKGSGTLKLSMRSALHPLKNLSRYRQRIGVRINHGKRQTLESFNSASLAYVDDWNHTAVTSESSHFMPLGEESNTIEIETNSDVLLRASVYRENVINPANESHLSWKVKDNLENLNQPTWYNSVREDGLKRKESILSLQKNVSDSSQRIELEKSANISTFMKPFYPTTIPAKSALQYYYYGIRTLYLEDMLQRVSTIRPSYESAHLNTLKKAMFAEVPLDAMSDKSVDLKVTLKNLYFKTRAYELDKGLKRQVETFVGHLGAYKHIYLYGHADSTVSHDANKALSLKRCQSIKKSMVELGIPAKDITIAFAREDDQRVQTSDEVTKASNRRVEIKVLYRVAEKKELEYQFDKPLDKDTNIEITLLNTDESDKKLDVYVDNKKYTTLQYSKDRHITGSSFSKGLSAYANNIHNNPDKILSILKNAQEHPIVTDTGTTIITVPKGSKSLRLARPNGMSGFKVSLRMRAGSAYKDTPYALAHTYSGTYKRFFDSLHKPLPLENAFDPWYEHTHPLRLWIQTKVSQAYKNIEKSDTTDHHLLDYAETSVQNNDMRVTIQIAKQALMLNSDKTIQKRAYDLLLKLSSNNAEKLIWHSAYFYRTQSSAALYEIAQILRQEGQLQYAQNLLLLLEKETGVVDQLCELSLLQNDIKLYEYVCLKENATSSYLDTDMFIEKKSSLITKEKNQKHLTSDTVNITSSAGLENIYNPPRDLTFQMHKATAAQPLSIHTTGPITLDFEIRLASPTTQYQWIKVEHNKEIYHYPITQYKDADTLKPRSMDNNISIINRLQLTLGEGNHTLKIHGYANPLLFSVKGHVPKPEDIKRLSDQILKTTWYDLSYWKTQKLHTSLVYASALLWNYSHGNLDDRYHAQSQASLLSSATLRPEVRSIVMLMTQYSKFTSYVSPEAPLGFTDIDVKVWNPISNIEKNRLRLLKNMDTFDMVLHGSDIKVIHIEGNQKFTLEAKQFTPSYFVYSPLKFGISLDDEKEVFIDFDRSQQNHVHHFNLEEGSHSIKVRLVDPISTHYLALNLMENGKRIEKKKTKRYYATSVEEPLMIHETGPKLLRIEERVSRESVHTRYQYLAEDKVYHTRILPSSGKKESLVHVSRLEFDPLKKLSLPSMSSADIPMLLHPKNRDYSTLLPEITQSILPIESDTPTISAQLKSLNKELGSDDAVDREAKTIMQVGAYFRASIDDNTYVKAHYFTNVYENPMLAFKHKLYTDVPTLHNTWTMVEVNGYLQENNHDWFTNLQLKTEIFSREDLTSQWSHQYGLGAFKYFLDYTTPNNEPLDTLVYSDYKVDHQHGIYLNYSLFYQPYEDLAFSVKTKLQSNEALNVIDYAKAQFNVYHHTHPFDTKLYYDKFYYFEDNDREHGYDIDRLGGKIRFENFFDTNRLQLEAGISYKFQNDYVGFDLGVTWHFSDNKRFDHFIPNEKIFTPLRLRLEDERE